MGKIECPPSPNPLTALTYCYPGIHTRLHFIKMPLQLDTPKPLCLFYRFFVLD